jgi:hypothetical protein
LFISGFAGFLPVFSCVLALNSLIINTIHFSGMHAFAGGFCGGVGGNFCFDNREIICCHNEWGFMGLW